MHKAILFLILQVVLMHPAMSQDALWSKPWHAGRAHIGARQVIIIDYRDKRYDTLNIYSYDKMGRQSTWTDFEDNKRYCVTNLSYKDTLCIGWETMYRYGDRENSTKTYDAKGNLLTYKYFRIKSGDTLLNEGSVYTYNSKKQLVKRQNIDHGQARSHVLYFYDKGRLARKEIYAFEGKNSYQEDLYYYNAAGLLDSTLSRRVNNEEKKELQYQAYTYKNRKPVKVIERNYKGELTITHHTYRADGKLDSSCAITDTAYYITTYEYLHGKLVAEKTRTNVFPMAVASYASFRTKDLYREFVLEGSYKYDSRGNLVEWSTLLNGELVDARKFIIEYY